ncbi:hypothetical protein GVM20_08685 [Porphyrobacter sp. SLTP]|nr:hypothetical protein [Porphyrobacter sp. SLTP]NBB25198.1 hypothetical protein [Porphyrobacter sp. SLTP]
MLRPCCVNILAEMGDDTPTGKLSGKLWLWNRNLWQGPHHAGVAEW